MARRPEGYANEYLGSTLLGSSGGEYAGIYGSQIEPISGVGSFNMGEPFSRSLTRCSILTTVRDGTYGFCALRQQPVYMPDYAGPSTAGPSTVPVSLPSAQLPSPFPASFAGPRFTPSPVPTLSWRKCLLYLQLRRDCLPTPSVSPPPSASYLEPDNCRSGLHDQPLAAPETSGKWPYQIPVGKGKGRATVRPSLTHPSSAGNTSE